MKENIDYKFVNVGVVYLELFGIYFKKYKLLKDFLNGVIIILINNVVE